MAFLNIIPSYTAAGVVPLVICSEEPVQNIESWFLLLFCRPRSNMLYQFQISSLWQTRFFVCVGVWISCLQFLFYWSTDTVQFNTQGKVNNEGTHTNTQTVTRRRVYKSEWFGKFRKHVWFVPTNYWQEICIWTGIKKWQHDCCYSCVVKKLRKLRIWEFFYLPFNSHRHWKIFFKQLKN